MAGMTGNDGTHKLAGGTQRLGLQLKQDTDQRSIVIQLTDTEGEWDSLDDTDLIFTLDCDGKKSLSSLRNQRPCSVDIQTEGEWGLSSPAFNIPLSPSSPGSLRNSFPPGSGFLSPTHRPLASLVKSLSTELELKESSLKPRPLLSLVKSISTELSRSEPEGVSIQVWFQAQFASVVTFHSAQKPQWWLTHRPSISSQLVPHRAKSQLLQNGARGHPTQALGGHAGTFEHVQ